MKLLSAWALAAVAAFGAAAAAADPPLAIPDCSATAAAPWASAGERYEVSASTQGESCTSATLRLVLISPHGRGLWELEYHGAAAVRELYGVPGAPEMKDALLAWITPAESDPRRSSELAAWPADAAGPDGFEPAAAMDRAAYEALRAEGRPLFCYGDAPGFDSCVALMTDDRVTAIGRRATR